MLKLLVAAGVVILIFLFSLSQIVLCAPADIYGQFYQSHPPVFYPYFSNNQFPFGRSEKTK
jgi:hypothetical protein